jgi:hypothetical protein
MKRLVLILTALALALPGSAVAEGPITAEITWARGVAVAYWHVSQPPCGRETFTLATVIPSTEPAYADLTACGITFSAALDWRAFPAYMCRNYVHEFGHLVLGTSYFAATNPSDPAHSPDPTNIMYGGGEPGDGPLASGQQEEEQELSVGCIAPIVHHPKHHHAPKHHRR